MTYIKQQDDGSLLLTAPVLIPFAKDCDFKNGEEPLTVEQVRAFKESYDKYGFVDHEHGLTKDGRKIGTPSKSIILDHDTTFTIYDGTSKTYPMGTWMLTTMLTDEEAISEALKGYYTGYSPSILPRASADKYLEALKTKGECSCKNISSMGNSLIKDVPDPVVLSVSLTRQPCLHESQFCELDNMEEDISLKSKILNAMGMSEEAEVIALKSEVSDLKAEIEAMKESFAESLKSMQEDFKQTLTEALTPVAEEEVVEVAEKAETEEEATEEDEPAEEVEVEEETEEEVEEEEEVVAEKGESKAEPVHDNIEAQKAKPQDIYTVLGRNPNGTRRL